MPNVKNKLKPFQAATVTWATKMLTKDRHSRRFLVADEVGLGKTIIAAGVIERLAENTKLRVVYVASSLDICHQNRKNLIPGKSDQVIPCDRICLLWEKVLEEVYPQIISLTPGTSIDMKSSSGNLAERSYIGVFLEKRFGKNSRVIANNLSWPASKESFMHRMKGWREKLSKGEAKLPERKIESAIKEAWEQDDLLSKMDQTIDGDKKELRKLAVGLRQGMAKAILTNLDPGLVILDEFQNYRKLLETDDHGKVKNSIAGELLKLETPTLLLSATPYPAYQSAADSLGPGSHVEQLKGTLLFLTGSKGDTEKVSKMLLEYADGLKKLKQQDRGQLDIVLEAKQRVEGVLRQYMARAERISFQSKEAVAAEERFLTDFASDSPLEIEHVKEWLKMKDHVKSHKNYLKLWRSGQAPMTYLDGYYDTVAPAKEKLSGDSTLYSNPGKARFQPKLDYLWQELLNNGDSGKYLWLPALTPYYKGEGVYSEDQLTTRRVKKGLVFSSWSFVPRMVTSELSAKLGKCRDLNAPSNPIKDSLTSWAMFFFPSPWLASIVSHSDFVNKQGKKFSSVLEATKTKILRYLKGTGWSKSKGEVQAWQVLAQLDLPSSMLQRRADWNSLMQKKRRSVFALKDLKDHDSKEPLPREFRRKILGYPDKKLYSDACVAKLARIALTSPSVCLLRTLGSIGVLDAAAPESQEFELVTDFCIRQWKAFFSRKGAAGVIRSYGKSRSFTVNLQRYLTHGNIQAVLDENLYLIQEKGTLDGLEKTLRRLARTLGAKSTTIKIDAGPRRGEKSIGTDLVKAFGQVTEESESRETVREAFNSPFWPFVLVTTSVGQEGLDFHLYCKDIYHWNLPSNPVNFEQREGRINRFNSYWVRQAIVDAVASKLKTENFFWDDLFKEAPVYAKLGERLSLGMCPHWTFLAEDDGNKKCGYVRHVMALPGSEEELRYESLLDSLELYRLTLGQPNQERFMAELKKNELLKALDIRGLMISLFPKDKLDHQEYLFNEYEKDKSHSRLEKDIGDLLSNLRKGNETLYLEIKCEAERHLLRLKESERGNEKDASLRALVYFLDPFDHIDDRTPFKGMEDDLEKMRR